MEEQVTSGSTDTGNTNSTPAPAATESSPAPAATPTPQQGTSGQGAVLTPPPAFTPDYKFKVLDKEYEIDPLYRGIAKDEETYKKIKEMHEKAFGLDSVKRQRDEFRDKAKTHEEKFTEVVSTLKEAGEYVNKGDFDSFFEAMGIAPQKVYQWVLNKVQYEQLPPEQKAIYDRERDATRKAMVLERQNQQLQNQTLEAATQARATELRQVISRPDVAKVMQAYDTRLGKDGAFIDAVIFAGQRAASNGRDISADEAVKEVLSLFGTLDSPAAPQAAAAPVQTPPAKPPVLPAVSGKGASPVKRQPKSLDDLRKMRAEMGD